jgi:hypothetical protein
MWETQIKQALKAAGLDEGLHTRITVASEKEIPDALKKLQRELDLEAVIKTLEDKGQKELFDKVLKSVVDQRVSQALKTREDKEKKDREANEARKKADAEAEKKNQEKEGLTEDQKTILELRESVKSLTEKITKIEATNTETSRAEKIKAALKEAGLPESLTKYVTGDNEATIKEQVEGLKTEITTLRQSDNNNLLPGERPGAGDASGNAMESVITEFAKGRGKSPEGSGGLASAQIAKNKKG